MIRKIPLRISVPQRVFVVWAGVLHQPTKFRLPTVTRSEVLNNGRISISFGPTWSLRGRPCLTPPAHQISSSYDQLFESS